MSHLKGWNADPYSDGLLSMLHIFLHYDDVIMTILASQITSLMVVYSIVYSGVNQRKHQSSASLAFVREIHRGPVNFPHKWPVTRKMFPFDDVIMISGDVDGIKRDISPRWRVNDIIGLLRTSEWNVSYCLLPNSDKRLYQHTLQSECHAEYGKNKET